MTRVEAGVRVLGFPAGRGVFRREEVRREVYLRSFLIDTHAVTVSEFSHVFPNFVAVGPYTEANYPITGVMWWDAFRYCAALGKRLPSADEWEVAAEFSAASSGARPNHWPSTGLQEAWGRAEDPERLWQMLGNVWEWTGALCVTNAGSRGDYIVAPVRGGSWRQCAKASRAGADLLVDASFRCDSIGFR